MVMLKEKERIDDLHRNNLKIIQHPRYFSFGMDAVLLAAFCKVHKNERHIDLCCGGGVIPLLLSARNTGAASFSGIEIQQDLADMAVRSVALNGLEDKITIHHGDVKASLDIFEQASFHVVTVNPPYMQEGSGEKNINREFAIARHEIMCSLDDVIKAAASLLNYGGRFYMVHRPGRLADIICSLRRYNMEPKTLRLVQPNACCPPNTLLIMAAKGGKPHLNIEKPLVVYDDKGQYTDEVRRIYYE